MIHILNSLSIVYAVAMTIAATGILIVMRSEGIYEGTVYAGILLLHGIAQMVYSVSLRSKLSLTVFKENGTLDGEWLFGATGKIVSQPPFFIVMICFASFVEVAVAFLGVVNFEHLLSPDFQNAEHILSFFLYLFGLLFSVPALVFNLRTWNLKWVMEDEKH